MDNRVNNKGIVGNKGGGGWPSIDREAWSKLKNEAIRQALEALTGDDKEFRQKIVLKMLDKCADIGEVAGNLQLIVKRFDGDNNNQSTTMAEESVGEQSEV